MQRQIFNKYLYLSIDLLQSISSEGNSSEHL